MEKKNLYYVDIINELSYNKNEVINVNNKKRSYTAISTVKSYMVDICNINKDLIWRNII